MDLIEEKKTVALHKFQGSQLVLYFWLGQQIWEDNKGFTAMKNYDSV